MLDAIIASLKKRIKNLIFLVEFRGVSHSKFAHEVPGKASFPFLKIIVVPARLLGPLFRHVYFHVTFKLVVTLIKRKGTTTTIMYISRYLIILLYLLTHRSYESKWTTRPPSRK